LGAWAPDAVICRFDCALQETNSVASAVVHCSVKQLKLDGAVRWADHIPEVLPVDGLGLLQRQVLDVQMRIAGCSDAVLGALELAAPLLASGPVAVILGVVGELAFVADQALKCFVK